MINLEREVNKEHLDIAQNSEAREMIENAAHDLKLMSYEISRCVTSGLEHFLKLLINTTKDVNEYKEIRNFASGNANSQRANAKFSS